MVLRLTVEDQGPNLILLRNLAFFLDLAIIADPRAVCGSYGLRFKSNGGRHFGKAREKAPLKL